jgi:hypothetical protein
VNNNVTLSVTVKDTSGTAISGARVRLTATETVGSVTSGDVLLSGTTNGSGLLEDTAFNYESAFNPSGVDINLVVRQSSGTPYYKESNSSGVITTSGFSTSIALILDE